MILSKVKIVALVAGLVAFVGLGLAILWLKKDLDAAHEKLGAAEQREATALAAAAQNLRELENFKGQQAGAEAVARAVLQQLDQQRAQYEQQNRRTYSAPLNQRSNDVVPGVVADTYDWLFQRRQDPGADRRADRPAGAAGGPDQRLPGAAPNAAPQRPPAQRRSPHRRRHDRADRRRRSLPHRGRRLEGLGHLHAAPAQGPGGGVPGPRRHPRAARSAGTRFSATVAAVVIGISSVAVAQDGRHGHGHSESHDWYRDLKQPGTGFSCCNGDTVDAEGKRREGDCRPVRATLDDDRRWMALIDGRWVSVPPRVVLQQLAPDGRSHICASKSGMIYCFLGGSPKI